MRRQSESLLDERIVPAKEGQAEVREKGSRFLAFAIPVATAEEVREALSRIERAHHDATHVAFAWKIGVGDAARLRSSDAGEPPGSAGRPIAVAIESAGLTDILVAVVRYFGGTKLGTGGLARAYREAATQALSTAGRKTRHNTCSVVVTCSYETLGMLRRLIRPPEVCLAQESFTETPVVRLNVLRTRLPELLAALEDARLSYNVEPVS